jgi:hypothetical protein
MTVKFLANTTLSQTVFVKLVTFEKKKKVVTASLYVK